MIGSGDAAFDYALNLSKHHQITLINRSNKIKCLPRLFQRVQESDTITYLQNLLLVKVGLIENQPLAIFKDTQTQQMIPFSMDYIVVAIGRTPRLDFLHQSLIERKDFLQDTNKLYFIGDVHHGRNRQCSIAIGDGIETAMKIYLLQDENR